MTERIQQEPNFEPVANTSRVSITANCHLLQPGLNRRALSARGKASSRELASRHNDLRYKHPYWFLAASVLPTLFQPSPGLYSAMATDLSRLFAKVFLVYGAVLAHDQRHNSRIFVFRRIGKNRESACHLSGHNVILRTACGLASLSGQYLEVVAVKRLWLVAGIPVTVNPNSRASKTNSPSRNQ